MNIYIDGELYAGPSVEILERLRAQTFTEFETLDAYIAFMSHNLWKSRGVGIHPRGETVEERAESFVQQLVEKGIAIKNPGDGESLS